MAAISVRFILESPLRSLSATYPSDAPSSSAKIVILAAIPNLYGANSGAPKKWAR